MLHLPGAPSPGPSLVPAARRLVGPLLHAWLDVDVEGRLPARGPVLVAANHTSHVDSIVMGISGGRTLWFLGDRALLRAPLLGPLLPRLGMIPVDRGTGDGAALDVLAGRLAEGAAVVVYPEGARSRTGQVHRPRSGIARLAAASGAPIVPVGIQGAAMAWPPGRRPRLTRRHHVRVRIGAPIDPPDATPAARRAATDALHDALVELSGCERSAGFAPVKGGGR